MVSSMLPIKVAMKQIVTVNTRELFEISANMINATGGGMLVISCVSAILNTLHLWMNNDKEVKLLFGPGKASLDAIRLHLGQMITYALELLVAADVIDTLTHPAQAYQMDSLYRLGVVVIIRATLSYFLRQEIEELEHKVLRDDEIYREHVRSHGRARATLRGEITDFEVEVEGEGDGARVEGEGISHSHFGGANGHAHLHESTHLYGQPSMRRKMLHIPNVGHKLTQLH